MSLLGRMFGRRERYIVDQRQMNEDWRVGDLAVCIRDDWIVRDAANPRINDVLRVKRIGEGTFNGYPGVEVLILGLGFEGKPSDYGWACQCFRKVRPDHREAEADFAARIKRLGRKVEPA